MSAISLRRTKDTALVGLPPKIVETCHVELSFEERKLYDEVKEEIKSLMMHHNSNDRLVSSYSTILSMILRLRQICADFSMVPLDFKSCLFSSTDIEGIFSPLPAMTFFMKLAMITFSHLGTSHLCFLLEA
jgi:SWI/SNF-related matrix-associated actin-dependent regulator of chromatin subfamily A3